MDSCVRFWIFEGLDKEEVFLQVALYDGGRKICHFLKEMETWCWIRLDPENKTGSIKLNVDGLHPYTFHIYRDKLVYEDLAIGKGKIEFYVSEAAITDFIECVTDEIMKRCSAFNEVFFHVFIAREFLSWRRKLRNHTTSRSIEEQEHSSMLY